ncbi:hypothetical protein CF328_g7226 [Tilletia controversa]|nr:hypothetical protein CF328_g7226 [Tilletia controversa]
MDTELASLSATLRGIEHLHALVAHASAKPQPFTDAFLNTPELPIISYIRDADPLEAGLFFYPGAQAQQQQQQQPQQQQQQQHAPAHEMTAEEQYALLNPRGPEIKPHQPPTPLRRPVPAGGKAAHDDYDALVLLLAAQKLLDNYHKAPRARKHIKTLQKRNADAAAQIASSESALAELEATALRRGVGVVPVPVPATSPAPPTAPTPTAAAPTDARLARRQEYQALQAELHRDDLECFALEGLIRDLRGERDVLMSPRKVAAASSGPVAGTGKRLGGGPRMSSLAPVGTSALGTMAGRRSSALGTTSSSSLRASLAGARGAPVTPARAGISGVSALDRSVGRGGAAVGGVGSLVEEGEEEEEEEEDDGDVGDETVSPMPNPSGRADLLGAPASQQTPARETVDVSSATQVETETAPTPSTSSSAAQRSFPIPSSTPELERISTSITNVLGDSLRFVHLLHPTLMNLASSGGAGGFAQTYEALHALAYPLDGAGACYGSLEVLTSSSALGGGGGPEADESLAETDAGSVLTTTSSSTAAVYANVEAPTPTSMAVAFVLLQLLGGAGDDDAAAGAAAGQVEFAALKTKTDEWWDAQRENFRTARQAVLKLSRHQQASPATAAAAACAAVQANVEKEEGWRGDSLATKAVYALVAKRLLRIRRAGGFAAVGFS